GQALVMRDDLHGAIPKIDDGPWPAFPADLTSIAVVTATQARGTVLIFEKMFESRFFFVDKLVQMGARIVLCDPHRVVVAGPSRRGGATGARANLPAARSCRPGGDLPGGNAGRSPDRLTPLGLRGLQAGDQAVRHGAVLALLPAMVEEFHDAHHRAPRRHRGD